MAETLEHWPLMSFGRDRLRGVARGIDDVDLSGLDDEELEITVADVEERVAVTVTLDRRTDAAADPGDMVLRELRKGDGT
jgi:hypothetical protein